MKILVPIKRVVDANVRVRIQDSGEGIDLNGTKMAINPFCEIALEEAIRLKEKGTASEVIAVSIGPDKCEEQIRTAYALGADRGLHILSESELEPLAIAKTLAAVVEKEQPSLVILGKQSIDGDNNQTGQMLAALCHFPQGTYASKVEVDQGSVVVTREVDTGMEKLKLSLPAVITTDLRLNEPRFASMPAIMKAKRKPIEKANVSDFGVDTAPRLTRVSLSAPKARPPGEIVDSVDDLIEKTNLREYLA